MQSVHDLERVGPVELLTIADTRWRNSVGVCWYDEAFNFLQLVATFRHWLSEIRNHRRATESQADGYFLSGRVQRVRIDSAGEWLRGFPELCMNSAQAVIAKEDATAVRTVRQPPALLEQRPTVRHDDRSIGNTVLRRPFLIKNPLAFFFRDFDQVLPATAGAVMATPVLNGW